MRTALFLLAAALALSARAADKPNILLIVSDDHGYADVGVYGCKDIPTPHMDSIAKNGVRFTSGYVSCSYCSPTRAALLTGRYQTRFGHEFNPPGGPTSEAERNQGLPRSETTIAQRLKAAGYATGIVGKWHLGFANGLTPTDRGFDEFFGFLGGSHSYVNARVGLVNPIQRGHEEVNEKEYLTDAFGREAVAFIERQSRAPATARAPWFLYLSFNAVHGPMDAAPRYLERFAHLSGGRKTYATMLAAMDDAIGGVLAKLRELRIEENTLVLFISDNGGPESVNSSDNGPLRGVKGQAFEGGIRVPFMVQWKGRVPAGKVYDEPVIQIDFAPTMLAAARVEVKPEWQFEGVNLLPFLRGEKTGAPHEALFWRFGAQMAVRMGEWKLVKSTGGGTVGNFTPTSRRDIVQNAPGGQLFHLGRDIGETTDLAAQEPEKARQLAAAWNTWNASNIDPVWFPNRAVAARQQRNAKAK